MKNRIALETVISKYNFISLDSFQILGDSNLGLNSGNTTISEKIYK